MWWLSPPSWWLNSEREGGSTNCGMMDQSERNIQMSELSMFDYITGITIGSIAAEMATSLEGDYKKPLTAMIVYGLLSILISYLTRKSIILRRFFEGRSILLYQDGQIFENNLLKSKIDVDEFLEMCRIEGFFDLENIHTAILEPNGKLSVIPMARERPVTPADLNLSPSQDVPMANVIIDGRILKNNLKSTGNNQRWLEKQLSANGVINMKEVMLATYDSNNNRLNIYGKSYLNKPDDIFR